MVSGRPWLVWACGAVVFLGLIAAGLIDLRRDSRPKGLRPYVWLFLKVAVVTFTAMMFIDILTQR